MKSYGIIFDTVFIRSGGDNVVADKVFNGAIEEINEFLKKNRVKSVKLYVPEIVLKEILAQRNERINKVVSSIGKGFEELSVFKVDAPTASYRETDYKTLLKEHSSAYLSKQGVSIVEPSEDALGELTERALSHAKPFKPEGDKGFKDTLLWLSTIGHFSSDSEDVCLLLSANTTDFNDSLAEEFSARTGKSIVFISTIQDLKEYLDKEIPLNLHLKRLHDEITNEIKGKVGDIVLYLNENQLPDSRSNSLWGSASAYEPIPMHWHPVADIDLFDSDRYSPGKKELIGYTYRGVTVDDIKSLGGEMYRIDAKVTVEKKYKDEPIRPAYLSRVFRPSLLDPRTASFSVTLIYHRDTRDIDITFCRESLSLG